MLRSNEIAHEAPDVGRLAFIAACIGAMPILAFLVAIWLTGGAPLTPLGQAPGVGATPLIQNPLIDSPVGQQAPASAITSAIAAEVTPAAPEVAANDIAVSPEPVTIGVPQ